ncbi:MAG: J domain-containing protein [Bacilli bacterium]
MDHYKTLGIERLASTEEIKKAYITRIREHSNETDPTMFRQIRESYEALMRLPSNQAYQMKRYTDTKYDTLSIKELKNAILSGDSSVALRLKLVDRLLDSEYFEGAIKILDALSARGELSRRESFVYGERFAEMDQYAEARKYLESAVSEAGAHFGYTAALARVLCVGFNDLRGARELVESWREQNKGILAEKDVFLEHIRLISYHSDSGYDMLLSIYSLHLELLMRSHPEIEDEIILSYYEIEQWLTKYNRYKGLSKVIMSVSNPKRFHETKESLQAFAEEMLHKSELYDEVDRLKDDQTAHPLFKEHVRLYYNCRFIKDRHQKSASIKNQLIDFFSTNRTLAVAKLLTIFIKYPRVAAETPLFQQLQDQFIEPK